METTNATHVKFLAFGQAHLNICPQLERHLAQRAPWVPMRDLPAKGACHLGAPTDSRQSRKAHITHS